MLDGNAGNGMEKTALERLEERVLRTPDRTAVICQPEERVTFRELWELSGRIYAWLKREGIGAEHVVMYCLPRGIRLFACMVGTMRAGAAFVLSETENVPARTAYIRENSGCRLFVDEACMKKILRTEPMEGYEPVQRHNLCYIAYTSGTTGHPKGVMHEYGSLDNAWKAVMVDGKAIMYDTDTFLAMSPMNFVAMTITYAYLCAHGVAVALMPYEYGKTRESFSDYLKRAGVTSGYVTPSFLQKHLPFAYPWHMCILSAEPADGLYVPGMKCYNAYASTESGCLLSIYELKQPMAPAPVGRSYSDVELMVLDEDGREMPPGTEGEICFKTPYVRGHINRFSGSPELSGDPELSGGSELPGSPELPRDPELSGGSELPGSPELSGDRLFHTGDAGVKDADGNLTVHGRIDEMFKIDGYRIEPDEVANAVTAVSGISHAVVRGFVYKDISAILLFYTDDIPVDPEEMREKLLRLIPEYMIPTEYIRLTEFPMLGSGKVDKLRLLPPEGSWDQFKHKNVAALPLLGKGRTANVYDMGNGKALKLFMPGIPFAIIRKELIQTRAVHAAGVPVPKAYEMVRSGDSYGILMDRIQGEQLECVIRDHPEDRRELIRSFAESVKALHHIRISGPDLPDVRDDSIRYSEQLGREFCTEEETDRIRRIFEYMPKADTYLHGDCHTGNAVIHTGNAATAPEGKIQYYDLMFSGKGHPVFDLLAMYSHYVFLPGYLSEAECLAKHGMSRAEAETLFDTFLEAYYSRAGAGEISRIREVIRGVHAARVCLARVTIPGAFTEEMLLEVKRRAVHFSERFCREGLQNEIMGWSEWE